MAWGVVEQIGKWCRAKAKGYNQAAKRAKAKRERRRAKKNPECDPQYKKYGGWTD